MNTVAKIDFDYRALDATLATDLQEKAKHIRFRVLRHTMDMIETGRDLLAVKDQLEHGAFTHWVEGEIGMAMRTAQGYMRAAQWADQEAKNANFALLQPTTVQRLAAPSCPSEVRAEVLERVANGEPVMDRAVADRIARVRDERVEAERRQKRAEEAKRSKDRFARLERQRKKEDDETRRHTSELKKAVARMAEAMHKYFPPEEWSHAKSIVGQYEAIFSPMWDGDQTCRPMLDAMKALEN